jgi:hypothetical protein
MTTETNGEAYGSKALTWSIIAAAALLLVEVTLPQAMPAASSAGAATVQTVTVSAGAERVARAN